MNDNKDEPREYDLTPDEGPSRGGAGEPAAAPPGFVVPEVVVEGPDEDPDEAAEAEAKRDAEVHRTGAILGYLFFVFPLLFSPRSRFARFHANQGLMIFMVEMGWWFVLLLYSLLRAFGPEVKALDTPMLMLRLLFWGIEVAGLVAIVVLVMQGIGHAAIGEMTELPVIGGGRLIRTDLFESGSV